VTPTNSFWAIGCMVQLSRNHFAEKSANRRSGSSKRVQRDGHHANSLPIMAVNGIVPLLCHHSGVGRSVSGKLGCINQWALSRHSFNIHKSTSRFSHCFGLRDHISFRVDSQPQQRADQKQHDHRNEGGIVTVASRCIRRNARQKAATYVAVFMARQLRRLSGKPIQHETYFRSTHQGLSPDHFSQRAYG
jgi:hypothetical protein